MQTITLLNNSIWQLLFNEKVLVRKRVIICVASFTESACLQWTVWRNRVDFIDSSRSSREQLEWLTVSYRWTGSRITGTTTKYDPSGSIKLPTGIKDTVCWSCYVQLSKGTINLFALYAASILHLLFVKSRDALMFIADSNRANNEEHQHQHTPHYNNI